MSKAASSANEPQLEIYKEKQRTIRKAITYGVILTIGVLIIFLGGKLKVNKEGIEISKDLLQSTSQKTNNSNNGTFTTGELNEEAREMVEKNKDKIQPSSFTGKNYINNDLGYLFSVEKPEQWNISYTPENVGNSDFVNYPVNQINAGDGILFKVAIANNTENENIESVAGGLYLMFTALAAEDPDLNPQITYDKPTQTAFFNGKNAQNYKRVLMKIVIANDKGYFAYVEYPDELENDSRVLELKNMVATLTPI